MESHEINLNTHKKAKPKIFAKLGKTPNIGAYFGLIAFIVVASFLSPIFLTTNNILNTLRQASAVGIVSVGATIVILSGGIDLSVGSVLSLGACMASGIMAKGVSPWLVTLYIILMGIAVGVVNGFIITNRQVEPFIITLGMSTVVQGIVLIYTKGSPIGQIAKSFKFVGAGYLFGIPVPVIIFATIVVLGLVMLRRTIFGRYVYSIGGNSEVARLSGIKVNKIKILVYVLSGVTAAIAGLVLAARVGVGDPNIGRGFELDAIAAAVIGGTSMAGGIGGLTGTIAGVLIIAIMNNLLNLMNVSPFTQQVVKGIIIIFAVVLQKKSKKK